MYIDKVKSLKQELLDYIISKTSKGEIYDVAVTANVRGKVINVNNGEKLVIKYIIGDGNDVPKSIRSLSIPEIAQIADQIYYY